jgi:alkylation response protein AidB-like acyl-CoA dehydrogenase
VDFALTADQTLMQASVAGVLDRACPLERVRAFAAGDDAAPYPADIWTALVDLGVPGLMIGEAHGGLGLGLLDAALVAEALGARVAPTPFLTSAVLAPLALTLAGSPAQRDAWLPRLAAGEITAGVAIHEAIAGRRDGAGVRLENGRLSGRALFALDAMGAGLLIVADDAGTLHLAEASAPGLDITPLTTIDRTRRVSELALNNVEAEPLPGDALPALRDAAWTMLAADMLGASGAMIAKAVAYARERKQFGRVIGSFQAVKHLCAEMAAQLEPCRALVWYAAYAAEAAPAEAPLMAAHAKALLGEVSRFVARTSTEVHGGMGFTDLLGLHYWFKRVGLDRQVLGGPERLRVEAARMQGLAA